MSSKLFRYKFLILKQVLNGELSDKTNGLKNPLALVKESFNVVFVVKYH